MKLQDKTQRIFLSAILGVQRSAFIVVLCLGGVAVWAAGNIDSTDKFAWASQTGWLNFSPTDGGVTVVKAGANGHLKGFLWAENIAWIKLGAGNGNGPYANASASDWGVNMDATGNLSGFGWSSQAGWINFSPTHGGTSVALDTGIFDGYAWGENIGWIHFKSDSSQYGVKAEIGPPPPPASVNGNWMLYE